MSGGLTKEEVDKFVEGLKPKDYNCNKLTVWRINSLDGYTRDTEVVVLDGKKTKEVQK